MKHKPKRKELDIYEEYKKISALCADYNFKCYYFFYKIKIITPYESWYFTPAENGVIKLFHGNSLGQTSKAYHKQFSRKMDYTELLAYIKQHGDAKYKGIQNLT